MSAATRREAVALGLAAAGGALAATTVPPLLRPGEAHAQTESDAAILLSAIGLEQNAVVAYRTLARRTLRGASRAAVLRLARHEQEHADAFIAALEERGGVAPEPLAPQQIDGLSDVSDENGALGLALELETMAVAQYYDAHQKVRDPELLRLLASVMASEGQHLVVVRRMLGLQRAPNAFETGEASQ